MAKPSPAKKPKAKKNNYFNEVGQILYFSPWSNSYSFDAGGAPIPEHQAYQVNAYKRCVDLITQSISTQPCKLKKKNAKGWNEESDHPLAQIFAGVANKDYVSFGMIIETLIRHALNFGNGYAVIKRNNLGEVELECIPACYVCPRMHEGSWLYFVKNPKTLQFAHVFSPKDIIHLRGSQSDGYVGKGMLQTSSDSIATAYEAQKFATNYMKNGMTPGGWVESNSPLNEDETKQMLDLFKDQYTNAFAIGYLPYGTKFNQNKVNANDGQFVESRTFADRQMAMLFGIPPALLTMVESGDKNTEQQAQNFLKYCLQPWIVKIEKELEIKLLSDQEKKDHQIRFNMNSLLRSDIRTRFEVYTKGIQWGITSPNEARALEDMYLIDDGDIHIQPLNFAPIGTAPKASVPKPSPAPEAKPSPEADKASTEEKGLDYGAILRPVAEATLKRLMVKESNAIQAALKKGKGAELAGIYTDHAALVSEAIQPIYAQAKALGLPVGDSTAFADQYCKQQVSALPSDQKEIDDWRSAALASSIENLIKSLKGEA